MSSRRVEIFCPKCQWKPRPADLWYCACHFAWNTFDTYGTCPECGKNWPDTQCLSCHKWSPHNDWYHEFASDEVAQETAVVKEPAKQN